MKKINLIKKCTFIFSSICLFFLIGLVTSCQDEEITSSEEVTSEEITDLKYFFNGINYSENDWDNYLTDSKKGKDSYFYTMAEKTIYVHEDASENELFQELMEHMLSKGKNPSDLLQAKSNDDCFFWNDTPNVDDNWFLSNGDIINYEHIRYCSGGDYSSRRFITKLTLYEHPNFAGKKMQIYFTDYIEEDGSSGNLQWKRTNSGKIDLPNQFKDIASSFKYKVIREPDLYAIYGNAIQNYKINWMVDMISTTSINGKCAFRKTLKINKRNNGTYITNNQYVDASNFNDYTANSCNLIFTGDWDNRIDWVRFQVSGGQVN